MAQYHPSSTPSGSSRHFTKDRAAIIVVAISVLAAATLSAAPCSRRVVIGNYGKLEGVANGYAWVAAGEATTVTSPNPCNYNGCFRDTAGQLCTKGSILALACTGQGTPQYKCNWDKNWGVVLGFNTAQPAGAWGSSAPHSVAVNYTSVAHAGSAGHFRLTAHVAGDPYSKQYCVDNYTPGAVVEPSNMKSQCWFNAGDTLANFTQVDTIGLLRVSENVPISFDFCVTAITTD
jgi:hypothetical protein